MSQIPIPVIAVTAKALADYYTHTGLETLAQRLDLFVSGMFSNKVEKAKAYLFECNNRLNPLGEYQKLIEELMDTPDSDRDFRKQRSDIEAILNQYGLSYSSVADEIQQSSGSIVAGESISAGGSISAAGSVTAGIKNRRQFTQLTDQKKSSTEKSLAQVFINHASEDAMLIEAFGRDLLPALGLNLHSDVFCTSLNGLGIPHGENWRDDIRKHMTACKVVIPVISQAYKKSEVCLNELGAAWMVNKPMLPLIVPPLQKGEVGVLVDVLQQRLINDDAELDEFETALRQHLGTSVNIPVWNKGKQNFLDSVKMLLSTHEANSKVFSKRTKTHSSLLPPSSPTQDTVATVNSQLGMEFNNQLKRLNTLQTLTAAYVLSILPIKTYRTTDFINLLSKFSEVIAGMGKKGKANAVTAMWNPGKGGRTDDKSRCIAIPTLRGFFRWNEIYDRETASNEIREYMMKKALTVPNDALVRQLAEVILK